MQNFLTKFIAIFFTVICLSIIHDTFLVNTIEEDAENYATSKIGDKFILDVSFEEAINANEL